MSQTVDVLSNFTASSLAVLGAAGEANLILMNASFSSFAAMAEVSFSELHELNQSDTVQALRANVIALTNITMSQFDVHPFTPVVTSAGGSPVIAMTSSVGAWSRVDALISHSFHLDGQCSGNPFGDMLISIPVPNASNQYQTGSIYAFLKGGAYQGPGQVTMLTTSDDPTLPQWLRVYYAGGPYTQALLTGEFQVIGTIQYMTSDPL